MGVVAGSLGNSPPQDVIRGIPFACDPVLRSARGSMQVLAPSDHGLRRLRRCDRLYVRSEPVPQLVGFLSMCFAFLPWLHRVLFCSVLLLMRRLHMIVLRMIVTCEIFRLNTALDVIFDVLKDFTSDSWDALLHLSTSPVPQLGKVDPELVSRGQVLMLGRFPKCRHKSGYTTPSILGAHKWATGQKNPYCLWCPRSLVPIERDKPYCLGGSLGGEMGNITPVVLGFTKVWRT